MNEYGYKPIGELQGPPPNRGTSISPAPARGAPAPPGGSGPICRAEKNYQRARAYRDLRESLLRCLALRGIDEELYRDKVREYMDFWVRRQELRDDIARRGLTVTDDRGRLMENRSVSLEIQVSRQMLAIFTTLGFKEDALAAAARGDDDDEL